MRHAIGILLVAALAGALATERIPDISDPGFHRSSYSPRQEARPPKPRPYQPPDIIILIPSSPKDMGSMYRYEHRCPPHCPENPNFYRYDDPDEVPCPPECSRKMEADVIPDISDPGFYRPSYSLREWARPQRPRPKPRPYQPPDITISIPSSQDDMDSIYRYASSDQVPCPPSCVGDRNYYRLDGPDKVFCPPECLRKMEVDVALSAAASGILRHHSSSRKGIPDISDLGPSYSPRQWARPQRHRPKPRPYQLPDITISIPSSPDDMGSMYRYASRDQVPCPPSCSEGEKYRYDGPDHFPCPPECSSGNMEVEVARSASAPGILRHRSSSRKGISALEDPVHYPGFDRPGYSPPWEIPTPFFLHTRPRLQNRQQLLPSPWLPNSADVRPRYGIDNPPPPCPPWCIEEVKPKYGIDNPERYPCPPVCAIPRPLDMVRSGLAPGILRHRSSSQKGGVHAIGLLVRLGLGKPDLGLKQVNSH